MRENMGLFRGKRVDTCEWVEGWYCKVAFGRWPLRDAIIPNEEAEAGNYHPYEVDPDTVGECTGLADKNGKLIFEGDICAIRNHRLISDTPFVVEWEAFVYNGWTWRDLDENSAVDSFANGAARQCEIIGNIHDNPELMEGAGKE